MTTKYIEEKITLEKILNRNLEVPSLSNLDEWAEIISIDLSPENLNCDGEISASQAEAEYRKIVTAVNWIRKNVEADFSDRLYEL